MAMFDGPWYECSGPTARQVREDVLKHINIIKTRSDEYENEKDIGYVSEKVYHALLSGSVPIYWGAPDVKKLIPSHKTGAFSSLILIEGISPTLEL